MKEKELTDEEKLAGQKEINQFFDTMPERAMETLHKLKEKIAQAETFDLLANISIYNHLHDVDYKDFRDDRMFVVSEIIALTALKNDYVSLSSIKEEHFAALVQEVQDLGFKLQGQQTILQIHGKSPRDVHSVEGIAFKTMRDETTVRNPSIPEHHLEIVAELYRPLEDEIKKKFGFGIQESVDIRNGIIDLVNKKINDARQGALDRAIRLANELFRYRSTKTVPADSSFTEEQFIEYNKNSRKQIKERCYASCIQSMFFKMGTICSFTVDELAGYTSLNKEAVEGFLKNFCCDFPAINSYEQITGPNTILKSRPVLHHGGRYFVPSLPLLTWCVEPEIEKYFKSVSKLQDKFAAIKHDFLLRKGVELLKRIFKKIGDEIPQNLFYHLSENDNKVYETDAVITYERSLLIIEAKGHRITVPAKEGKILRTKEHLEKIIKDSYEQGLRTLDYIKAAPSSDFFTRNNQKYEFRRNDFDDYILISLTLEPLGNITPLIRATNELGYFKPGVFPWIISLYDLMIIADHLELPEFLLHYIKRRKQFLEKKIMSVFEEIDLLGYYLFNGLYIEQLFRDAQEKQVNEVYLDNQTDGINNYYIHKYRLETLDPPKVKPSISPIILKLLYALSKSSFPYRSEIMMRLLDLNRGSMHMIADYIEKIKRMFSKDFERHDCSIVTYIWGQNVGVTFMTAIDKMELDVQLHKYCFFKMREQNAHAWICIGDQNTNQSDFTIASAFIAVNNTNL